MERIVLAYSGGLDTSVAIPWLAERYDAEVIAVTLNLGQGEHLDAARERALATGAVNAYVIDVQEEFAHGYILPALQAGAIYEDRYPLATALGRPLIAQKLVEIAHVEGAGAIARRLHREGERPGPPRRIGPRARSAPQGDRAGAPVGHDTGRRDRVRQGARHSGGGHQAEPVQRRREPLGPIRSSAAGSRTPGRSRPRTPSRSPAPPPIAPTCRCTWRSGSTTACRPRSTASRCR